MCHRTPLEARYYADPAFYHSQNSTEKSQLQEIYKESERLQEVLHRFIKPSSNCIDIGVHLGSLLSEII